MKPHAGPGVPRHQLPVRPAERGEDGGAARLRRRAILSEPRQGRAGGGFLHRLGRARRRHDELLRADAGLRPPARLRPRGPAGRPPHRDRGRRRARRGQHLRGAARRLEARHPRSLVDHRLQPPIPRQRGARPPVRPHRGPVPRHGLERRHPQIRPASSRPPSPARAARSSAAGSTTARTASIPRSPSRAAPPGARRCSPISAARRASAPSSTR